MNPNTIKNSQLLQPLFEFSGACTGCGETPYVKLVSSSLATAHHRQCHWLHSIYGGNLPTTPWAFNKEGRGPAWSNSLFEDNAEFGLGMRLTIDKQTEYAHFLLKQMSAELGTLAEELVSADQSSELGIKQQRERVVALKAKLAGKKDPNPATCSPSPICSSKNRLDHGR